MLLILRPHKLKTRPNLCKATTTHINNRLCDDSAHMKDHDLAKPTELHVHNLLQDFLNLYLGATGTSESTSQRTSLSASSLLLPPGNYD